MLSYEDYVSKYQSINENEFNQLFEMVENQFMNVVEKFVPHWKIDLVDLTDNYLDKAFALQINMLKNLDYLNTQYDGMKGIAQITTTGFTIDYSKRNNKDFDFPLNGIASSIIKIYLRKKGLLYLGVV